MAKAVSEKGGLDWHEFRALECFAIIYDVAIDEEQYNPEWCRLDAPTLHEPYVLGEAKGNAEPWVTDPYLLFRDNPESPGDLPDVTINASFISAQLPYLQGLTLPKKLKDGELPFPALKGESDDQVSSLWRRLLLAKHVRAELQRDGSTTALETLDKLGLALLRAMPLLKREIKLTKLSKLEVQLFILKTLFLNETAACYQGYQSISLADDCLNLIKNVVGEGETPYELVALYNKAQGRLHIRDYDKALRDFEEVDKKPSDKQKRNYYRASDNRHLRWPGLKKLFDAYVGYPSVLQCAETLLKLQRSWEAEKRLDRAEAGPATAYQIARGVILKAQIANDRGSAVPLPAWDEDDAPPHNHNLIVQRRAVQGERALVDCRLKTADAVGALRDDERDSATEAIHASLEELGRATEKLRSRIELATKNRSEIDDACLSWAEGLSACKELLSYAEKDDAANTRSEVLRGVRGYFRLRTDKFRLREVAVGLCLDQVNREHAIEVRKTLIKNLFSIHNLRAPHGFERLFADIAKCLKDLLCGLIKDPPRFTSEIEIRGWREQRTLLRRGLLPDERPGSSARREELRAFVSYGFVHPLEDDGALDAARRKADLGVWRNCQKHQCVECGRKVLAKNPSFMSAESGSKTLHHLDRLVQINRDLIEERLYQQQRHDAGWHFMVLQRWNSYTPAMRSSEGGGYFLFHAGEEGKNRPGPIDVGVVIDPGYGFVKNFFSEGFGVCDITAIVITHDHPDHLADVDSLVNLLFEARKNRGGEARKVPKVEMLLSRGAFERLNPLIESAREVFRDTVVLDPDRTTYDVAGKKLLSLSACLALHRDSSHRSRRGGFDSVGLIGEIPVGSDSKVRIAIPSDTKWDRKSSQKFTKGPCDLICLHLGSIVPEKFELISYFDEEKTSLKVLHKKHHLYLPGVVWYLEDLLREHSGNGMPTMVILSEFGEELAGGVRIDIAKRLQAYTEERGKGKVVVLPGDVGLRVDPTVHTIRCSCCHLEHPWTTPFHCETSGSSEEIRYVCPRCFRNLTQKERAKSFANNHPFLPGTKS